MWREVVDIGAASGDRTFSTALLSVTYRKHVAAGAVNATIPVDHCTLLHAGRRIASSIHHRCRRISVPFNHGTVRLRSGCPPRWRIPIRQIPLFRWRFPALLTNHIFGTPIGPVGVRLTQ
jgi:hypothetical protein